DEFGRVRIFHGVNAVRKQPPWYPEYFIDDAHMDDLASLGMNVIRLGTMWSGFEPEEGGYNQTYIDVIGDMIQRLAVRGIYSMLDMHQDVLTSKYESYDGIPRWLVDKFPEPTNPYPFPLEEVTFWEEGYLTQAVSEAFQYFYDNYEGAIDKWGDFWAKVASCYSHMPGVFGYNLINEPWVGDYTRNASLLFPGLAGRVNLMPNYDKINDRIREHDPAGIIFYEPVLYGQLQHDINNGSGFTEVPGGPDSINASAYSYHTYSIEGCIDSLLPQKFRAQADNVALTGGASILTEFGLCKPSTDDGINIECNAYMQLADEFLQSWIDWDHSDMIWFNPDGSLKLEKVYDYTRAYAQAIAGTPVSMKFDPSSSDFHLDFIADTNIQAPTEIFVPKLRYSNGYSVQASPGLQWTTDGDHVLVTVADPDLLRDISSIHLVLVQ
ncbi:hypothetical protein CAPTEDRAFT_117937, partial [Capitella teleta]